MATTSWKGYVTREYYETDAEFLRDVLPVGTVDGSAFGLIADATEYYLAQGDDEVHIRAQIAELKSILNSLRQGGIRVSAEDARKSVERFAELWEERIREAGKWEELVARAREADEIRRAADLEAQEREGFFARLMRRLLGG